MRQIAPHILNIINYFHCNLFILRTKVRFLFETSKKIGEKVQKSVRHRIKDIEVMEKMEQQEGMLPDFILGEEMAGYDLPFWAMVIAMIPRAYGT